MTRAMADEVYYDPYDVEINADPYPTFRRLRDEAPLYYNERHDFWALSRYEDCARVFLDNKTFISGRGGILELMKSGMELPPGIVLFEDPPTHTMHRRLLSRMFTPKRVASLEPNIREFCIATLDALEGRERFDFVKDLGAQVPMRVISMLMGIPEEDQEDVRDRVDDFLRTDPGQPMSYETDHFAGEHFAKYLDWRMEHPTDDIMTELLHAEFEDDQGVVRTLSREELLVYINVVNGAGNETTNRLIGWAGKVLADHPDQRHELAENASLIPNAIEELLRLEPPAPHVGRWVAENVEFHGRTIPADSALLILPGSANHDERQFDEPECFDIHRQIGQILTFGYGIHFCLGAALARLEGRIVLEEVFKRFRDWEVDDEGAELASTSTVRGWESLPVVLA